MENISIETIKESNRIKREGIESCKQQLKGVLSDEQLEMFEDAFYKATKNYIFKKKETN